jgi:ubiquinol-cytochrome c reductase cytochrome b subunit
VGSFFNVTNFGQMYSYHVYLLPLAVVAIVIAHVLLVRRHGIVPPFQLSDRGEPTAREPEPARQPDSAPVGGRAS